MQASVAVTSNTLRYNLSTLGYEVRTADAAVWPQGGPCTYTPKRSPTVVHYLIYQHYLSTRLDKFRMSNDAFYVRY
jgi:hypothetical protein